MASPALYDGGSMLQEQARRLLLKAANTEAGRKAAVGPLRRIEALAETE